MCLIKTRVTGLWLFLAIKVSWILRQELCMGLQCVCNYFLWSPFLKSQRLYKIQLISLLLVRIYYFFPHLCNNDLYVWKMPRSIHTFLSFPLSISVLIIIILMVVVINSWFRLCCSSVPQSSGLFFPLSCLHNQGNHMVYVVYGKHKGKLWFI